MRTLIFSESVVRSKFCPAIVATIIAVATTAAMAQGEARSPLARYVPAEGLSVLLEHDGLHSQPAAWKETSTYKMLHETSLGTMLNDILTQAIDQGLRSQQAIKITGKEVVGLLSHLIEKGFVIGYCGTFSPPEPKAGVFVIRDAKTNETFKKLLAQIPPLNEPAAKVIEAPGGRKVWTLDGAPIRFWYEKDDFVGSFAPPGALDPVVNTLEGKSPSAVTLPLRQSLVKGEADYVPVGLFFLDVTKLPPMPADAVKAGFDSIKAVEAAWGIQGKATVTMLGIQAPRPRKGVLAAFDQPPIGTDTRFVSKDGKGDFTIVSVDPAKFLDTVVALVQGSNPDIHKQLKDISDRFKARTGLSVRDDLLTKVGPRMAFTSGQSMNLMNVFGMWFYPPELGIVAELRDEQGFEKTLDRLMEVVNRELKAAGALVPPTEGEPNRKGTEFAEFRKLKPPEFGYVLAVPPSVLPLPAGLRPTVIVDQKNGVVAFGTIPTEARKALSSLALKSKDAKPFVASDGIMLSQVDQSNAVPEVLTSIPSLVQLLAFSVAQDQARQGKPNPAFRLAIDPDSIPTPDSMRTFMFPSRFSLNVNDDAIRFSSIQPFPLTLPQMNIGSEAPVLIALLLPAVQSAREAARRAQCTNNLKQMGLAMHNYASSKNALPARAICDKNGKPLLSWRVAILPYLEQQALYEKFKLDEPWDSPNNKELIKYMPQLFACPSGSQTIPTSGLTPYQVFAGEGALLDLTKKVSFAKITDGTSNTIMAIEAESLVTWTKPDDIDNDAVLKNNSSGLQGAGSKHPNGVNALFADGSVRFLKTSISRNVMKALISRAGGEIVGSDSY